MTQRKQAGDNGAGLLTWVQGLAPAHLYLSEERSARFLSRRERFNRGTPGRSFLHSGNCALPSDLAQVRMSRSARPITRLASSFAGEAALPARVRVLRR